MPTETTSSPTDYQRQYREYVAQERAREEAERFILPELPPTAAAFSCQDFGGYCARGYNPSASSGSIGGIPISVLRDPSTAWLKPTRVGSSGSILRIFDAAGHPLGRITLPSSGARRITRKPEEFLRLGFIPEATINGTTPLRKR